MRKIDELTNEIMSGYLNKKESLVGNRLMFDDDEVVRDFIIERLELHGNKGYLFRIEYYGVYAYLETKWIDKSSIIDYVFECDSHLNLF